MTKTSEEAAGGVDLTTLSIPPESTLLRTAYKKSGLTVSDLASATGLSTATIQNAMSGLRYRAGTARATAPPDHTLVKLASVLHVQPEALRANGRERAADVLAQAPEPAVLPSDLDAQAVATGRQALARQVLAVFSTEELRAEVSRRDRAEHQEMDQEARQDLTESLRADQWPL